MRQGGGRRDSRVLLEERFFRNSESFQGSVEVWNGWVFNLSSQIGSVSRKVAQLVEKVLAGNEKVATKAAMDAFVGKHALEKKLRRDV